MAKYCTFGYIVIYIEALLVFSQSVRLRRVSAFCEIKAVQQPTRTHGSHRRVFELTKQTQIYEKMKNKRMNLIAVKAQQPDQMKLLFLYGEEEKKPQKTPDGCQINL